MNTRITKTSENLSCGSTCGNSRRSFLSNCAKCIGAAGAFSGLLLPAMFSTKGCTPPKPSMKVRVVFALHSDIQQVPDWPNIGFDFNPIMERIMNALTTGCKGIEFVSSMIARGPQAESLRDADKTAGDIDGYLVIQMNCWNLAVEQLVESGKPVLYADYLYAGSGGFLVYTGRLLNAEKPNFAHMSTGNLEHLVAAVNCFPLAKGSGGVSAFVDGVTKVRKNIVAGVNADMTCINDKFDVLSTNDLMKELKGKKMLEYEVGWEDLGAQTKETLGFEIERRKFTELNGLYEKADRDQAMEIVNRWKNNAEGIVGVRDMTLEKSARFYLAMKQALKNNNACGITINCLGGFYGGHIQAYPCLGFKELLDEGLIGACECDTLSTLTQMVMTTMTKGRPGFISDPVMDVAKKEIIYAHCVASIKAFGPQGPSNPYTIMTHSEDRAGASLRSTLPVGYMTTSVMMHPGKKEILFHQAKTVGNSLEDKACRTKLAAVPVGDFETLFTEWGRWGWHRLTYYGDLKEPVYALADSLGWKIIAEA